MLYWTHVEKFFIEIDRKVAVNLTLTIIEQATSVSLS